jgi:N-acetylglucosamine malate deacetylase 2
MYVPTLAVAHDSSMKRFRVEFLFMMFALVAIGVGAPNAGQAPQPHVRPIRALLIVAHPDDEYEMAGTIYKFTTELSGVVDQVIITDGEGGYRYSSLGARYYGVDLTNEATGRAKLPHIREEEARRAGRILGIAHQWFLNERDDHFTLSADEALKSWRTQRVLRELEEHLKQGHYDAVFVVLPTEDTHGEHKAASILALEAVKSIPANERPAVLGAEAGSETSVKYTTLTAHPIAATTSSTPQFHFDRNVHFGFRNSLSYQIVVDWVIAEHKSQGLFQTKCGQDRFENFWTFAISGDSALKRTNAVFEPISRQSQPNEHAASAPVSSGKAW